MCGGGGVEDAVGRCGGSWRGGRHFIIGIVWLHLYGIKNSLEMNALLTSNFSMF